MRVLLIKDTFENYDVRDFLEKKGFIVEIFGLSENIEVVLEKKLYNLVILDMDSSCTDWISIEKNIKSRTKQPMIIITSYLGLDCKIEGLESGADDYLTRPFDMRELEARINTVMRRTGNEIKECIVIGNLEINIEKRHFILDEKPVKLTQKEFLIMEYLLRYRGKPVSRTDIIEYIWGNEAIFGGDGKLDVYISNIRGKLGHSLIETVKGFGYEIK